MGQTQCKTQVFFEKNQYYLGENATVRLQIDNSQCGKDIKSCKFKLMRYYKGQENGTYATQASEYLFSQKFPGLAAG